MPLSLLEYWILFTGYFGPNKCILSCYMILTRKWPECILDHFQTNNRKFEKIETARLAVKSPYLH